MKKDKDSKLTQPTLSKLQSWIKFHISKLQVAGEWVRQEVLLIVSNLEVCVQAVF